MLLTIVISIFSIKSDSKFKQRKYNMGNIFSIPFSQQKSLRNLAVVMGMLLAMLCSGRAVAQTLEWAKQAGGTDFDGGWGIAVDT